MLGTVPRLTSARPSKNHPPSPSLLFVPFATLHQQHEHGKIMVNIGEKEARPGDERRNINAEGSLYQAETNTKLVSRRYFHSPTWFTFIIIIFSIFFFFHIHLFFSITRNDYVKRGQQCLCRNLSFCVRVCAYIVQLVERRRMRNKC